MMTVRFLLLMGVAGCLVTSCTDEATPDDDTSQDDDTSEGEDDDQTGSTVSQDAGRKDARASSSEPSNDDDDDDDDQQTDGDGQAQGDAGKPSQAGRDAGLGSIDGAVADAGAARDGGRAPDGNRDGGRDAAAGAGASGCDALTYETFGKEFLSTYCVSCHGADSLFGSLDSLQRVVAEKDEAKSRVSSMIMPPPIIAEVQPTAEARMKFLQWLDCGPK